MGSDYAIRYYMRLQKTLGSNIGASSISVRQTWSDSTYYIRTKHISIGGQMESKEEFLSGLFHECFHSWIRAQKIPRRFFKIFSSGSKYGYTKKISLKMQIDNEPAPIGFISNYMPDWEEDAAEIFSALVLNNFRTSGYVSYNNYTTKLEKDPLLKKKFQTMKKVIKYVRKQQ